MSNDDSAVVPSAAPGPWSEVMSALTGGALARVFDEKKHVYFKHSDAVPISAANEK